METYTEKQKAYIDSVDGAAHNSAVLIIGELEAQIQDQRKQIGALASDLLFALKYMKARSGEPFMIQTGEDGAVKMVSIDDAFIGTLALVGIEIDRDKLDKIRSPKRKR